MKKTVETNPLDSSLSGTKKASPFLVPEGYFHDLPERVNTRIISRTQPTTSFSLRPLALSLSFASILLLAYLVFPYLGDKEQDLFESYYIDEHLLIEQLVEHRMNSQEEDDSYIQVLIESNISASEIITYF